MEIRKGIPVSSGYAIATALVLDAEQYRIKKRQISKTASVADEVARFEQAVEAAKNDLTQMKRQWSARVGKKLSELFDAHILVFEDKRILQEIRRRIEEDRFTPEYAVSRVFRKYAKLFMELEEGYFRERVADIRDAERRLLRHLLGERMESLTRLKDEVIIIAHDLTPTQTAALDKRKVKGFATDAGGPTSHTAIVAKALDIPAVVGLGSISGDVSGGDRVIIDGSRGHVILNPDEETLKKYRGLERDHLRLEKRLHEELHDLPAETRDGAKVRLLANIEFPREIDLSLSHGAEGVGLFRSEFLYGKGKEPTEAQHVEVYQEAIRKLDGRPLVVRTFDLGGDKRFTRDAAVEPNPILGCRSIRHSFLHLDAFKTQIRGILRASAAGDIRILFPMISSVDEMARARAIVDEAKAELAKSGVPFNPRLPIGAMLEVPSAVLVADLLANHVDFFSVGTNDLIQYTLAVDRVNERVADLYQPTHPAMLRLLKHLVEVSDRREIPLSICGEMAGDPMYTLLLMGLGVRELSLAPARITDVKKVIRSVTTGDAAEVARQALSFDEASKTTAFLRERTLALVPEALA